MIHNTYYIIHTSIEFIYVEIRWNAAIFLDISQLYEKLKKKMPHTYYHSQCIIIISFRIFSSLLSLSILSVWLCCCSIFFPLDQNMCGIFLMHDILIMFQKKKGLMKDCFHTHTYILFSMLLHNISVRLLSQSKMSMTFLIYFKEKSVPNPTKQKEKQKL